jgi:hypothetical protein
VGVKDPSNLCPLMGIGQAHRLRYPVADTQDSVQLLRNTPIPFAPIGGMQQKLPPVPA